LNMRLWQVSTHCHKPAGGKTQQPHFSGR
jgi:hypothetical protein